MSLKEWAKAAGICKATWEVELTDVHLEEGGSLKRWPQEEAR